MAALGVVLIIIGVIFLVILCIGYFAESISLFQDEPIRGVLGILATVVCLVFGIWALTTGQSLTPPGPGPCAPAPSCPSGDYPLPGQTG